MESRQTPFCGWPFEKLRVSCDGKAFFCCYQREQSLGDLTELSLEEVWFGEQAEEIRRETLRGGLHEHCTVEGCPALYRPLHATADRKTQLPRVLEIDLPDDHCNIGGKNPGEDSPACIMCQRDSPNYKLNRSEAIYDVLPRLRALVPGLRELHVQGIAESFWHDAMFRVLDLLEFGPFRHQIQVSTFTNGIAFNRARRERFLESCPRSSIHFSIDAGSPETYQRIRRLDAYGVVLENLAAYSRERKAYPGAKLSIHNNLNTLNLHEALPMVRMAAEVEVDLLIFSPTIGHRTDILVNPSNAHLFREAQQAIAEEARKLGVPIEFYRPLDSGLSDDGRVAELKASKTSGFVERLRRGVLTGWARDPKRPGVPLEVVVFEGKRRIASGLADQERADIGRHGFRIELPVRDLPKEGCRLSVKLLNPKLELRGSPLEYRYERRKPPEGHLESWAEGKIRGWAWDPEEPGRKLEIEVLIDNELAGTVLADQYRKDLEAGGIGDGSHTFSLVLPPELLSRAGSISARVRDPQQELFGSPVTRPVTRPAASVEGSA